MRTIFSLVVGLVLTAATPAQAGFHFWDFKEVYSSADGSVQFIELFTASGNQQFTNRSRITSGSNTFSFPSNTPAPTRNHHLLLATPGFADLDGGVAPDFEIPVDFFDPLGDTLTYIFTVDPSITFTNLPTDGIGSLHFPVFPDPGNVGTPGVNSPTNFAGVSGSIVPATGMPSDLTSDGFVDFDGLAILLTNWDQEVSAVLGNLVSQDDTVVNFDDLAVLLTDWTGPDPAGSPAAALGAQAVPEPSSLMLALGALLGMLAIGRQRQRLTSP